ncbi:hypothetical protein BDY17DRAFT_323715 [Neohortaea acidophila]|uniref:Uncharacterized protein n=1 Tax=Neohortaea acidophila TaxID=245834 RepID=A0A6A6PU00_9PEZI|nr:uncharacterized protein BDY17DRAFT_323715 [Neohortaea acidophila]KAF2482943.1 hypothetical protein BDY17DRAFT_323715 [Neohortaea acidophila]
MQNLRDKIKRKLSIHDKNPDLSSYDDPEDIDDETAGYLQREADKAEESDQPHGKPGSFLNKLIMHGNKKTEEQLAREQALSSQNK